MPGMNSGLNPADPTLVAAFRSALLHQGAIAIIILAFLGLLWARARTWRMATPAAKQEEGAGTGTAGAADPDGAAHRIMSRWSAAGAGRGFRRRLAGRGRRGGPPVPAGLGGDQVQVLGLTVWRLAGAGWTKIQVMNVPISYGSSG